MQRRQFVERLSIGSAVAAAAGGLLAAGNDVAAQSSHSNHAQVSGPLANATVSFGAWPMPLDRLAPPPPGPPPNVHEMFP